MRGSISDPHTIMVVDDDPSNLDALEDLLSSQYEVLTASDGREALEAIKQDPERERIHLLISDQRMPGLTGAEFLSHTKILLPKAKRILLTGYTDVEAIIELVNEGDLYKFILKPFDHNVVQATVRRALEAFDMEQQNKRLIKQLTMLNVNLERTVEARTQELQETLGELEEALQNLKQLNATKDKFFSIVAHDLRNTLQAFMYTSESMVSFIDTFDKHRIASLALTMNKMATNLHELLENLLSWAQIQKGQLEVHPAPVHMAGLARQLIALFEEKAEIKSLALHVSISSDLWVMADQNIVKTVLRNLLSNAIKFTHEGGQVELTARREDDAARIIVSDNGVGISADDLEEIMRLDMATSHEGTAGEQGTGLGLPLCKELLETAGTSLALHSEPGKGTQASFCVPLTTMP